MWLIGKDFYFRLKQLLSGGSTPQMCRQPTADLFRRKFVIFSCHTQSMPAKNCLFPAQNLWLIARRQFMRCCPKRKKTPASNQWVMDTGASRMIYMISVMLLFFQRTQKSPAWTCIQTGLWNVILAGEGFGSKNNSKLRDDIYFVVKVWKSIPTPEYLIFRGEKGWHSQRSTTKAPISRCFCSWHLFVLYRWLYRTKKIFSVQRLSDRRRESTVNLGIAEFPQGGFIPPEDALCWQKRCAYSQSPKNSNCVCSQ